MDMTHFGDSYDIAKRALLIWLQEIGPWAACPMFTPGVTGEQAAAYSNFLGIELASIELLSGNTDREAYFAGIESKCHNIFLDPTTGVKIAQGNRQRKPKWIYVDEVAKIANRKPECLLLAFDQSLRRGQEQANLREKLILFKQEKIWGFAYNSHASFLILGKNDSVVTRAKEVLILNSGLPNCRLLELED